VKILVINPNSLVAVAVKVAVPPQPLDSYF